MNRSTDSLFGYNDSMFCTEALDDKNAKTIFYDTNLLNASANSMNVT